MSVQNVTALTYTPEFLREHPPQATHEQKSLTEAIKDALAECIEALPDSTKLADLANEFEENQRVLDREREVLREMLENYEQAHTQFEAGIRSYTKKLDTALEDTWYLNEGPGQWEEYERDINEEQHDLNREKKAATKTLEEITRMEGPFWKNIHLQFTILVENISACIQSVINCTYDYKASLRLIKRLEGDISHLRTLERSLEPYLEAWTSSFDVPIDIEGSDDPFESMTNEEFLSLPYTPQGPYTREPMTPEASICLGVQGFCNYAASYVNEVKPSKLFSAQLANRAIIEAAGDDNVGFYRSSLESFHEAFDSLREELDSPTIGNLPEAIEQFTSALEELHGDAETLLWWVDDRAGELQPERPDEDFEPFTREVLEEESGDLESLVIDIKSIVTIWDEYQHELLELHADLVDVIEKVEQYDKAALTAQRKLRDSLQKMIKKPKTRSSHAAENTLSSEQVQLLAAYDDLLQEQEELNRAKSKNRFWLEKIYERLGREIVQRMNSDQKIAWRYTEWKQLDESIEKARATAGAVFSACLDPESTFIHASQGNRRDLWTLQKTSTHPLHSPIVHLLNYALNGRVSKGFKFNFGSPRYKLSAFEHGALFAVLGKNSTIVTQSQHYKSEEPVVPDVAIKSALPDIYSRFTGVSTQPPKKGSLEDKKRLFSFLSLHIAETYLSSKVRSGIDGGNPVACLLVSPKFEIIGWSVNTSDKEPIRHAEVNVLLSQLGQDDLVNIPDSSWLFTSLKPCHMCAGAILDTIEHEKRTIRVVYALDDPNQKDTCLDGRQEQFQHNVLGKIQKTYLENKRNNAARCLELPEVECYISEIREELRKMLKGEDSILNFLKQIQATKGVVQN